MKIYFSDFFSVDPDELERYGALNISLISDLPLFVDPFLLFHSKKPGYRKIHQEMIKYVGFLKEKALAGAVPDSLLKAWYTFSEVKQNWLGWSLTGNKGRGLGMDFARSLHDNLNTVFANFGNESLKIGVHIEKVCLIRDGVGRDNISDFATNLAKKYLCEYTQEFARQHLSRSLKKRVRVKKVTFNYKTEAWEDRTFVLPRYGKDYVLLTPEDILTKDDIWISQVDLLHDYDHIAAAVPNDQLRAQIDNYFRSVLPKKKKDEEHTTAERHEAIRKVLERFPVLLDYFIKDREKHGNRAVKKSLTKVEQTKGLFVEQVSALVELLAKGSFYEVQGDSYDAALKRVHFLKDAIEHNDGYRFFWMGSTSIEHERDLQLIYRLTWYGTRFSVDSEVNNGRGPVDYKISEGSRDSSLVEFKLASNTKLRDNLENQVAVYSKANKTRKAVKVIIYFTAKQKKRVLGILKDLKLEKEESIVLVDARKDNKISASKVKSKRSQSRQK
jgi:hypothetical protein